MLVYRQKTLNRKILAAVMCVFLAVVLVMPLKTKAQDHSEIVRVGYYENEVFQEGAKEGSVKTGYSYEYYLKLSEYTGWKYEYVYGSFGDLYQMLLDGKVDLLAEDNEMNQLIANAFEEDKQMAINSGMNGHLAKPYDIPQITKTLAELLNC